MFYWKPVQQRYKVQVCDATAAQYLFKRPDKNISNTYLKLDF